MQKKVLPLSLTIFFFFATVPAFSAEVEDPLKSIRQLAGEVYKVAEDMLFHGSEGHMDEIVSYGESMTAKAETLLEKIEALESPRIKGKKKRIVTAIKDTIQMGRIAMELAKRGKSRSAVRAASKVSFRAKKVRQRLQMIR